MSRYTAIRAMLRAGQDLASDRKPRRLQWGRRRDDRWLERWMRTTQDLARLQYSHRMIDAVIDEIDGRRIRIGQHWLTDYASCNYLGLDLDEEIIAAVPEYLARCDRTGRPRRPLAFAAADPS